MVHRLRSCGRLSCPTVCGIFVSQPGIKLSPALEGGFLPTGPPGIHPTVNIRFILLWFSIVLILEAMLLDLKGNWARIAPARTVHFEDSTLTLQDTALFSLFFTALSNIWSPQGGGPGAQCLELCSVSAGLFMHMDASVDLGVACWFSPASEWCLSLTLISFMTGHGSRLGKETHTDTPHPPTDTHTFSGRFAETSSQTLWRHWTLQPWGRI